MFQDRKQDNLSPYFPFLSSLSESRLSVYADQSKTEHHQVYGVYFTIIPLLSKQGQTNSAISNICDLPLSKASDTNNSF